MLFIPDTGVKVEVGGLVGVACTLVGVVWTLGDGEDVCEWSLLPRRLMVGGRGTRLGPGEGGVAG